MPEPERPDPHPSHSGTRLKYRAYLAGFLMTMLLLSIIAYPFFRYYSFRWQNPDRYFPAHYTGEWREYDEGFLTASYRLKDGLFDGEYIAYNRRRLLPQPSFSITYKNGIKDGVCLVYAKGYPDNIRMQQYVEKGMLREVRRNSPVQDDGQMLPPITRSYSADGLSSMTKEPDHLTKFRQNITQATGRFPWLAQIPEWYLLDPIPFDAKGREVLPDWIRPLTDHGGDAQFWQLVKENQFCGIDFADFRVCCSLFFNQRLINISEESYNKALSSP